MKTLTFKIWNLGVLLTACTMLFFASCEKDDVNTNGPQEAIELTSIQDVLNLNLDKKFEIPEKTYEEFIESIEFVDNKFSGCYYKEIDELFDSRTSQEFWKNFNIQVRPGYQQDSPSSAKSCQYLDKKNKFWTKGCKPKCGHICKLC